MREKKEVKEEKPGGEKSLAFLVISSEFPEKARRVAQNEAVGDGS